MYRKNKTLPEKLALKVKFGRNLALKGSKNWSKTALNHSDMYRMVNWCENTDENWGVIYVTDWRRGSGWKGISRKF